MKARRLRLLGRDFAGFRRAVQAHAAAWDGGTVVAGWVGLPQLQHATLGPGEPAADVLLVPADWVPALAARAQIVPLTDQVRQAPPEGWPGAWFPSFRDGISWDGELYGLPFHDGPQLLFTRPDLLAAAATGPPRAWADLLELAAVLQGVDHAGTVLAGAPDGHNNVYDLVLHLWRLDGELVSGDRLVVDSGPMRAALAFLRDVATRLVPPGAHRMDSNDSGAAFAAGQVGVALNWAGYAALATEAGIDFACAVAPLRDDGTPTTTVNAFWVACVTSGCAEPAAAWDYLRHAGSAAMDLETTRAGASGARVSTWADPGVLAAHPEYALFAAAHRNSRPLPRIPQLPRLVDVLSELVDAVVWRGEPAGPALAVAQTAADALVGRSRKPSGKTSSSIRS